MKSYNLFSPKIGFVLLFLLLGFNKAFSVDKNIFLKKYLVDPFSKTKSEDINYSGNLYWNYQGQPLTFLVVYYQEIQWSLDNNGRTDLIVPVGYCTDPNLANVQNFYLIFHNETKINKINTNNGIILQHWNPNPDVKPYNRPRDPYPANGIIVNQRYNVTTPGAIGVFGPLANQPFYADLNGDGLTDSGILSFSTTNPSFNGILLNFNTIKINTGYGMVAETDIPEMIRDTRFGYITAFANTLFNNSSSNGSSNQSQDVQLSITNQSFAKSNDQVNIPSEIDFEIMRRQAFVPNLFFYNLGIKLGIDDASAFSNSFNNLKSMTNSYSNAVSHLISNHTDTDIKDFVANVNNVTPDAALTPNQKENINFIQVLNSPLFTPRRINENFNPIVNSNAAATNNLSSDQLKSLFKQLHTNIIVQTSNPNERMFNSPRIVGMCLAFLNLMNMRTTSDYVTSFLTTTNVNNFNNSLDNSNASTLKSLSNSSRDLSKLSTVDFVTASISSGYSDMSVLALNDLSQAAYISGYKQAQNDDLQKLKNYFGAEIPGITSATNIDDAINGIGGFINSQTAEINHLNNIITGLETTITNLNTLLTNANNLISQLQITNQDLQNTIRKVGNTADAATGLLKAGTGFLVGGPVGAAICYFFCSVKRDSSHFNKYVNLNFQTTRSLSDLTLKMIENSISHVNIFSSSNIEV